MSSLFSPVWGAARSILPTGLIFQSNGQKLNDRFGNNPHVEAIYQEYFSTYANNLLPLDKATLNQIGELAKRKEIGLAIGREWSRVLGTDRLDGTHRPIQNENLLKQALGAEFIFQKRLADIKTIDRYQRLYHGKVLPELNTLKKAERDCKKWICCSRRKYTQEEESFLKELRGKAKSDLICFDQQLAKSIEMREHLLSDIQKKVEEIRKKEFLPEETVWLQSDSGELKNLLAASQKETLAETLKISLHDSIKDHYVVTLGDPFKEVDSVFMIIKRPGGMSPESWIDFVSTADMEPFKKLIKQQQIQDQLSKRDHRNKEVVKWGTDFTMSVRTPYKDKKGKVHQIEASYESVSEVSNRHAERDVGMKTRRKLVKEGVFTRGNTIAKDYLLRRVFKWAENRELTAGSDCHEAISLSRTMMGKILSGELSDISSKIAQNSGEYFFSLPSSDLAHLPGSYMEHPNFLQTLELQKFIYQSQTERYQQKNSISYLEEGIQGGFNSKKYGSRIDVLAQNVYESYIPWSQNLELFLEELKNPQNRSIKDVLGADTVAHLEAFLPLLQRFVQESIPYEIRDALRERQEIIQRHRGILNPVMVKELDQVWEQWKRVRGPQEIDTVLSDACFQLNRTFQELMERLVELNLPFSSVKKQGEIVDVINQGNPLLFSLYNKAIPPIWQNKARLSLVQKDLMSGTELSPLWLQEAEMFAKGDAALRKHELERSRLAKEELEIRSKIS